MEFNVFYNRHIYRGYADAVAGNGATLHNCFGFVEETIPRICRLILNERVVYNGFTRVHGERFCQMARLSTLKGNGKAEDMTVYYVLPFGSTKSIPVVGIF